MASTIGPYSSSTYVRPTAAELAAARAAVTAQASKSTDLTGPAKPASDSVTLSPAAARLVSASNNLKTLENSGGDLAAIWTKALENAKVGDTQRDAADQEVAGLAQTDPDHYDQASQARIFDLSVRNGKAVVDNPFAGLPRKDLTAVVADQSGLYTAYEREAAQREMGTQQNTWVQRYAAIGQGSGDFSGFYNEAASQYGKLTDLEKSTYPDGYLAQVQKAQGDGTTGANADPFWWLGNNPDSNDIEVATGFKADLGGAGV
jgi:hypothetical protein